MTNGYTCEDADINKDGKVDEADRVLMEQAWGSRPGDPNWNPAADINRDGVVDLVDLTILGQCYTAKKIPWVPIILGLGIGGYLLYYVLKK